MLWWWNDKATNHIFRPAAFPQTQKGDNQWQIVLLVQMWSVDMNNYHSLYLLKMMQFPFYWKEKQRQHLQQYQLYFLIHNLNKQDQVYYCHYMAALHKQDHDRLHHLKRLLQMSVKQVVKDNIKILITLVSINKKDINRIESLWWYPVFIITFLLFCLS